MPTHRNLLGRSFALLLCASFLLLSTASQTIASDGNWIAFSGQYGGNTDVYVMPATGGQPRRLTWHPGADVVQGPPAPIRYRRPGGGRR